MNMKFRGYELRPVQLIAIPFLESAEKFVGAELLTGSGKSLLAVYLQDHSDFCDIITCNNNLATELAEKFELKAVMGRTNYGSKREYRAAHKIASESKNCVFNPMSYIFHQLSWGFRKPKKIVIDEAHKLIPFVRSAAHFTLKLASAQEYASVKKKGTNEVDEWAVHSILSRKFFKLKTLLEKYEKTKPDQAVKWQAEMMHIAFLYETVVSCAPDYTFELRKTKGTVLSYEVVITPVFVPKLIMKKFFNADQIVFLSGTMPKTVFDELCFEDAAQVYRQFDHPTPKHNRAIHWTPVASKSRKIPEEWKKQLQPILTKHKNIVFHCTYGDAPKIADLLIHMGIPKNKIFTYNSKSSKSDSVAKFKYSGGILLACGLDEGIDFPYAECDAVIVGRIRYPYIGDQDVSKRLAQPNGQVWYDVTTASSLFQQLGRGCRAPDDKCSMYVFDPMFPRLITKTKKHINKSLTSAILWS